ncbi:60S acidic ribosomal protein P2 [Tilletia horrida]|uniref:60S acidic ribosomal protein P2 n=1 Tax=Tilletia horrida TaxID=155126 RepID=A0AAN6GI17_9BASI|nr:60S acidic ribosomal protein P2 [Tilletia horrida]KAK0538851.1 60S acidic ribosomal protein P2 [Tilletia horrida]KAK0540778.1 60S acidic ribosomal protein P2 [Tilletia horrida]KAK0560587.1 60S acidic ribosomal protein P2 [Tilletia horrida]
MKYIAAYLLLQSAGNATPSAEDITKVLEAAEVEIDTERLEKLLSELEGKDISEVIAEGSSKLASVPSGGAVASGGAAPAAAGGAAPEAAKEEEKKEEEKEESDDDMGFGLFD